MATQKTILASSPCAQRCCGAVCPDNITECPSEYTASISDFIDICSGANGDYTLTKQTTYWSYTGVTVGGVPGWDNITITLACVDGYWVLTVSGESWGDDYDCNPNFEGERRNTTDCPPTGTYEMVSVLASCCNVPTVSLS